MSSIYFLELFSNFQILLWSMCWFLSVFLFCFETNLLLHKNWYQSKEWLTTVLVENKPSMTNDGSKKSSNASTRSTWLFTTSRRWWLCWLSKGNMNPWSDNQTNVATGKRTTTTTDVGHRSSWKSMAEARFTRVQPQIAIFTSPICYECMRVEIGELLGVVMTTTSSEGFLMNKMSFVHLFKMVMIFDFHSKRIFKKGSNEGWIVHLEKMIFVSIIGLTIRVKITKNLGWKWIYQALTVDYTLKIFSIRSNTVENFFDYLNIS